MRPKKLQDMYMQYEFKNFHMLILTHTHNTMSTDYMYTTLEYEFRYKNKDTDLIWCLESVVCSLQ